MAKRNGLGELLLAGGYSLGNDIQSYQYGGGTALMDVTGIDKSAHERIGGRGDARMSAVAFFNDAIGQEHPVFKALPSTDFQMVIAHGQTLGQPSAALQGKLLDYAGTRAADGMLTFNVNNLPNGYSLFVGESLTAGIRNDGSTATNGTAIDFGSVSTLFGLTAWCQVPALTSGSPTIKLQDSADNSVFADITGATFGVVALNGTYLVQTAANATVRRYVRVISTGTFAGLQFYAGFMRHLTAQI